MNFKCWEGLSSLEGRALTFDSERVRLEKNLEPPVDVFDWDRM